MRKCRLIFLLLLYVVMLVFTLSMEWLGIQKPTMRAVVNISTIAMALLGVAVCVLLYRSKPKAGENGVEKSAVQEKNREPVFNKEAYLLLAREKGLTSRETEIGLLVVNGYSNRRIAEELYISEFTVKKHLTNIYEKTGTSGRKELKQKLGGE